MVRRSERAGTAVVTSSGGPSVATRSAAPQARFWDAESTEQSAPASGSARWWTECTAVSTVKTVSTSDSATATARPRAGRAGPPPPGERAQEGEADHEERAHR